MNSNKQVSVFDNTVSAREYISYTAEQAGGFACIGRDGKLYIKTIGQDIANVNIELFQDYTWGEQFNVSRIAYEDGIQDFKFGDETNNTIWIDSNNMYIVDSEQVENIYNQLENFNCYSFEGTTIIDPALDIGDLITIDNKKVIYQGDMEYVGKFKVSISSKIEAKQKEETTRTVVSDKTKIRRVQSQIDQVEGTITQLVQETGEYDEKISKVEQSVDSINQKISNITDFTREITTKHEIHLKDTAKGLGFVLDFKIKGSTDNFIYLTPSNALILSNTLVPLGQRFNIICDKQSRGNISSEAIIKEITMEQPLRDYLGIYDELDIKDNKITVIRRIGVNTDLSLYILENEIIEDYGEFNLTTFEGDTYIYIKEYYNLEYYAQYLIKNDYLDTFATKLEMNTSIEQTNDSIMLEVNKKVGEEEFGTLIKQSPDSIKYAWNQISEFIQLMILNNNASFAILDKDKKIIMSLDKNGQHFFKDGQQVFGEMGIQNIDDEQFISFSVEGEYGKQIENGMAWGIKTKSDGQFYPILSVRNFAMGDKNSDTAYGELELSSCNLVLNGFGTGIKTGGILVHGDPTEETGIYFFDINNSKNLLSISPDNAFGYANIKILDNIYFSKNQLGSNTFKIGYNSDKCCFFTDDGWISCETFYCNSNVSIDGDTELYGGATIGFNSNSDWKGCSVYGNLNVTYGNVYADNISSDRRVKKNIKDSDTGALNIIKQIRHRQFETKKDGVHYDIGYIAQEIEKIDRNFVMKREKTENLEERYYINELPIIATATKAIQEQEEIIEQLQEGDKEKDMIIQDLIKRIEKLEKEVNNGKDNI